MRGYSDAELLSMLEKCESKYGKVTIRLIEEDEKFASEEAFRGHFGSFSKAKKAADIEKKGTLQLTDEEREALDQKVRNSDKYRSLIEGMLMGDASINEASGKNYCYLQSNMINKQFLNWFDDALGPISTGVSSYRSGEEQAALAQETGFTTTVNVENYNDLWHLQTYSLPVFNEYREWYESGRKRYPSNLELTPLSAKMWYCCDGYMKIDSGNARIRVSNEADRKEYLRNLFERVGFEPKISSEYVRFTGSETERILSWMGEPPKGFRYKWVTDKQRYENLKRESKLDSRENHPTSPSFHQTDIQ